MSQDSLFTILLPVVRPPHFLPFAIRSVLAQAETSFELLVVCDGAPSATVEAAKAFAANDDRIRVLPFEKGLRHGEAHRHVALGQARGGLVCQIADDDLWLPNHLVEMTQLLARYDFGNTANVMIRPEGGALAHGGDLRIAAVRAGMVKGVYNPFGPTFAGYTMDAYRRLPEGWAPAPEGVTTDLHMWRKFLALPGLRVGTRPVVTGVHLGTPERKAWSIEDRVRETERFLEMTRTSQGRDAIRALAGDSLVETLWAARAGEARRDDRIKAAEARIAELEARLAARG